MKTKTAKPQPEAAPLHAWDDAISHLERTLLRHARGSRIDYYCGAGISLAVVVYWRAVELVEPAEDLKPMLGRFEGRWVLDERFRQEAIQIIDRHVADVVSRSRPRPRKANPLASAIAGMVRARRHLQTDWPEHGQAAQIIASLGERLIAGIDEERAAAKRKALLQ
jgi:hypothetical protein